MIYRNLGSFTFGQKNPPPFLEKSHHQVADRRWADDRQGADQNQKIMIYRKS
jgi:hypothetical protein